MDDFDAGAAPGAPRAAPSRLPSVAVGRSVLVPDACVFSAAGARAIVPLGELPTDPVAEADIPLYRDWFSAKRPPTRRQYRRITVSLLEHFPNRPLSSFAASDVNAFIESRMRSLGSVDSLATEIDVLRALFTYAHKRGHVSKNISIDFYKQVRTKRSERIREKVISQEQARLVIAQTESHRDRVLLATLYATGARVSEIAGRTWANLTEGKDGSGNLLVIGKGGRARTVAIPAKTTHLILSLKVPGALAADPIFASERNPHEALKAGSIWQRVKVAAARAGVTEKLSPHWFRHMHATHSLENGCPLSALPERLGHADIRTTGAYLAVVQGINPADFLDDGLAVPVLEAAAGRGEKMFLLG